MSLMMLGPVIFDHKVNPQSLSQSSETPFAVHEVMGARPVREFMGEGDGTIEISGVLFPHHFGGMDGLALLEAARVAHTPLPFMRGTLSAFGWVLIQKLTTEDTDIGELGVGMEIAFTASLVRTGTPGSGLAGVIMGLFR